MVITADRIDKIAFRERQHHRHTDHQPASNQNVLEIGSGWFDGMSELKTVTFEGQVSFGTYFRNYPNLVKATFLNADKDQRFGGFTRNIFGKNRNTNVTVYGSGSGQLDNSQKFASTNGEILSRIVGTTPDGSWTVIPDATGCSTWAKEIHSEERCDHPHGQQSLHRRRRDRRCRPGHREWVFPHRVQPSAETSPGSRPRPC